MKELRKKIEDVSLEAKEIINNLLEEGNDASAIKYAMEDGAFLLEAGISQEISEEIHFFLSDIEKRRNGGKR